MAWVQQKGDSRSNAYMVQQLALFNKYNPGYWTAQHCPCSTDMSSQTQESSIRSEELTHCMLNFYTERYHEQKDELNQWKQQYNDVEGRATRLYRTVADQQTAINHFQFQIHAINEENASLFQTAMMMLDMVPQDQVSTFRGLIAAAIGTPNHEIIDLTADEELSDIE